MYKVHKNWSTPEAAEAGITSACPVPGRADAERLLMAPPYGSPGPVEKETPDKQHTQMITVVKAAVRKITGCSQEVLQRP